MRNDEIPTIPDVSMARNNLYQFLSSRGTEVPDKVWNDFATVTFTAGLALGMARQIAEKNAELERINRQFSDLNAAHKHTEELCVHLIEENREIRGRRE